MVSIFSYLGNPTVVSMSLYLQVQANLTIFSVLFYLENPTVVGMSFCLEIEANLLVV